ncbi:MAG: hypothetical protein Q9227_008525 [Pyrenula ochraceoflavens]
MPSSRKRVFSSTYSQPSSSSLFTSKPPARRFNCQQPSQLLFSRHGPPPVPHFLPKIRHLLRKAHQAHLCTSAAKNADDWLLDRDRAAWQAGLFDKRRGRIDESRLKEKEKVEIGYWSAAQKGFVLWVARGVGGKRRKSRLKGRVRVLRNEMVPGEEEDDEEVTLSEAGENEPGHEMLAISPVHCETRQDKNHRRKKRREKHRQQKKRKNEPDPALLSAINQIRAFVEEHIITFPSVTSAAVAARRTYKPLEDSRRQIREKLLEIEQMDKRAGKLVVEAMEEELGRWECGMVMQTAACKVQG